MGIFNRKIIQYIVYPTHSLFEWGAQKIATRVQASVQSSVDRWMDPRFQVDRSGEILPSEKVRLYTRALGLGISQLSQEMGTGFLKFFGRDRESFVKNFTRSVRGTSAEAPTAIFGTAVYLLGRTANDSALSIYIGVKKISSSQSTEEKVLGLSALLGGVAGMLGLISGGLVPKNPSAPFKPSMVSSNPSAGLALTPAGASISSVEGSIGPVLAPVASVMAKEGGGVSKKGTGSPSQEELVRLLKKHHGDIKKVAEETGLKEGTIKIMMMRRKKSQPAKGKVSVAETTRGKSAPRQKPKEDENWLEVFREHRRKSKIPAQPKGKTDQEIIAALREENGIVKNTWEKLGYQSHSGLAKRLKRIRNRNPERFEGLPIRRAPKPAPVSKDPKVMGRIAQQLNVNGGNISKTARDLGMSKDTIYRVLNEAIPESRLGMLRRQPRKSGPPARVIDEKLVYETWRRLGSVSKAANELNIPNSTLNRHIKRSKRGSPLWLLKGGK